MDLIEGDAFGDALLARLDGGPDTLVIERDDGLLEVDASDYLATPGTDPHWPWIRARVSGRTLDVGSGGGRAALALQGEGVDVTALDVSAGALEVCRRRGIEHRFHGTAADLAATGPESFTTFVAIGNNLGLLGSPDGAADLLGALRSMASADARLVGTMLDPHHTADPDHLAYHDANRQAGRPPGQVRLRVRHRRTASAWFDILWLSPSELARVAGDCGWQVTATSGPGAIYAAELRPAR